MIAGRVAQYDAMQYRLRVEPNLDGREGEAVSGRLIAPMATSTTAQIEFLDLSVFIASNQKRADVRLLDTPYSWSGTGTGACEVVLELTNPRWYVFPTTDGTPRWYFTCDGVRIWIDGTERTDHPYTAFGTTNNYFAPAGLPAGACELLAPLPTTGALNTGGNCESWSDSTSVDATVRGGYRYRQGTDWIAYPVRVELEPRQDENCSGLTTPAPNIVGTDTWNVALTNRHSIHISNQSLGTVRCRCPCPDSQGNWVYVDIPVYQRTSSESSLSASVWIVPDLPRRFVWLGENLTHEYMMYREKLPRVAVTRYRTASVTQTDCDYPDGRTICSVTLSDSVEWHPQRAELLYVHNASTDNALNDGTQEPIRALYSYSAGAVKHVSHYYCLSGPAACPACSHEEPNQDRYCCPPPADYFTRTRFSTDAHTWSVDDNCHPYYRHDDTALRWLNTVCAPFWNYLCWLQDWALDVNGDGVAETVPLVEYWRPHQCQHIENASLPTEIRTKRRSYLLMDSLTNATWSGWTEALWSLPTGWIGSVRPTALDWLPADDLTLDSSSQPRWSATNATLTFTGAGITVVPTATTHTLEFELADFAVPPHLYPALADKVEIAGIAPFTSLTIELVSATGDAVTIATTLGTHPIPAGDQNEYAGTWARQYAADLAGYSEQGYDLDADGVSAATFADPERATLWQLLQARAGARLRITVQQDVPTPYTLQYPRFLREPAVTAFATDNGAHTCPFIRNEQTANFGLLEYAVGNETPSLRAPHTNMSLYDALAFRRQLQLGQSGANGSDILSDANALGYDTDEHADAPNELRLTTRARLLPYTNGLVLWLTNDWRECPPLPTLPARRWLSETRDFGGEWGQWVYVCAPNARYYLANADVALVQRDGANETVLTEYDRAVGRYRLFLQRVALDGTETLQHPTREWRLRRETRDLARTTPFFSHAMLVPAPPAPPPPAVAIPLTVSQLRDRLYYASQRTVLTANALPLLRTPINITTPRPLAALDANDRTTQPQVLIGYQNDDSTVTLALLVGEGPIVERWTMPGKQILVQTFGELYRLYAWVLDTENRVWVRESPDQGLTWTDPASCTLDGNAFIADALGDVTLDRRQGVLFLSYQQGEQIRIASSEDGVAWITRLP